MLSVIFESAMLHLLVCHTQILCQFQGIAWHNGLVLQDTLSETASSADSQEQSEQQDSSDEESGDSETAAQPVDTCDTLHMTRNERTLSASQRQQLRNGLAEQLDELKVQQAAQSMQLLGL